MPGIVLNPPDDVVVQPRPLHAAACAPIRSEIMANRHDNDEAEAILRPRLEALTRLSWLEMDAYGEKEETVETPSGKRFRVVTGAFWDMDEWASGMELYAKAYPESGRRRRRPYTLWASRGGPDDPVHQPPPGWRPPRRVLGIRLGRTPRRSD
jgi:hypothetical protein